MTLSIMSRRRTGIVEELQSLILESCVLQFLLQALVLRTKGVKVGL